MTVPSIKTSSVISCDGGVTPAFGSLGTALYVTCQTALLPLVTSCSFVGPHFHPSGSVAIDSIILLAFFDIRPDEPMTLRMLASALESTWLVYVFPKAWLTWPKGSRA